MLVTDGAWERSAELGQVFGNHAVLTLGCVCVFCVCLCLYLSLCVYIYTGALRFLRRMIGLKDDFYNRYIVKCDLLKPVTDAFVANGLVRYNLFNSAVIELFEFILTVRLATSCYIV